MKKAIASILTAATLCAAIVAPNTTNTNIRTLLNASMIQTIESHAAGYTTGTYKVNTSIGVNVRSGSGTGYSIVGAATNNTQFTVNKVSGSWGFTSSIACSNGTKKSGWVCLDYCKVISTSSPSASSNNSTSSVTNTSKTYQVNTSSGVNVRSGSGTGYSIVGAATNGTQFTVTKVSGDWGYTTIKCTNGTRTGWVCLSYCKSVSASSSSASSGSKSVTTYSFQKAYNYAKTYWNKRNYNYNYYSGKNCANFVSQCLVAGGIPTSSTWKNGSSAFVNCGSLKSYFTNNYGVKYISYPSASSIKPGDVIYTNGGGHVMFVMKVSGNTIYASGNTNNRDCLAMSTGSICGVLQTSQLLK